MHATMTEALSFLAIAVVVTPLCTRLGISPILGYLVAGSAVGPHGLALVEDGPGTSLLGELGIVFLLFMIGLELSFERLRVIRHYIFGLGTAQVVLTTAAIAGLLVTMVGMEWDGAVLLGCAFAFSSTAFVLQVLTERNATTSQLGRVAVAILILQDLAVVPLLVAVPLLGGERELVMPLLIALAKAAATLAAIFVVSRFALRPVFHLVAATRAPDTFVAAALLVALGTAFTTEQAGLSPALGAFMAGVMLAGTEYRHQVEADIQPLRGLLLGLFFLSVGMLVDPADVVLQGDKILLALMVLLALKTALITVLARAFRFDWLHALQLGLLLAQGGEFAFVVLSRGASHGVIPPALLDLLVTVIAASMALTPFLASLGRRLVMRWSHHAGESHKPGGEVHDLTDHVVIAGFGRVGQTVGSILRQRGIPYVAVDRSPSLVSHVRERGDDMVYFGDSRRVEVLKSVGAGRARALVITLDDHGASQILARLRPEMPHLRIIVRARDRKHAQRLEAEGASAVVPETLEGSLQLASQVLHSLGTPREEIFTLLECYRKDDYALLAHTILPEERR